MTPSLACTRRIHLRGLAGGAAGVLAAACGPLGGAPRESAPARTKTRVQLRFLTPAGWNEAIEQMLPTWNEQNPLIQVQWTGPKWPFIDAVMTQAAGGDLDDVLYYWFGEQAPQIWFVSGVVRAVDAYVKSHKLNPREWYRAQWEMMFVDGKQIAVPAAGQVHCLGLYYNKNLFDEQGLKYPDATWTLDTMIEAAEKLKVVEGGEVTRWGVDSHIPDLFGELMPAYTRNFDAELFSPDQKRYILGEGPEFLRMLNWYTEMMQKRIGVMYSKGGDRAGQGTGKWVGLLQGKVAMIYKGWMGATGAMAGFLKDNPQVRYGLTFTPKGPTGRRGAYATSAGIFITGASKHPEEAFEFTKWVTGREFGVALGLQRSGSTTIHPRPDVYHDERLQQDPYIPKDVAQFKAQSLDWVEKREEDAGHIRTKPWNFRIVEIFEQEKRTTQKVFTWESPGNQDVVNELRRLVQPIMEKERALASDSWG